MPKFFRALCLFSVLFCSACTGDFSDLSQAGPSFETLSIAYAEPISSYSPLSYNTVDRKYLGNLYEPLVRFDGTFNTDSALAVSWGRLDDTTWDFQLRQGVTFHSGEAFTADDAVYSLGLAKVEGDSELGALLSTIVDVKKISDSRIEITTSKADPLLLNKLTYVYMVPNGYTSFDLPIGTGPYRVSSFSDKALNLERFDAYWGAQGYFPKVSLKFVPEVEQRNAGFLDGTYSVLANVPPQYVQDYKDAGYELEEFPSLEVSYLMMSRDGTFSNSNLREAVWYALSADYASSFGGGFLQNTSQYAATGIFGYRSDEVSREQNLDLAKQFRALVEGDVAVTLDVPEGLKVLGEAIAKDLSEVQIEVTVNELNPQALDDKIKAEQSEFYFFGWKYDLADASDFYEAAVHSHSEDFGQFNGVNYQDSDLDALIEQAASSLSVEERRDTLDEISARLLDDKSIIPLFESKTLYGLQAGLYWNLRLDGQLWASEIIESVVK